MANLIANFSVETANAPGTSVTVNLAGAVTGRPAIGLGFATGTPGYWVLDDGAQQEISYGNYTSGSPNTIARTTVIWNSVVGTTAPAKLNFTGTTYVYSFVPASKAPVLDSSGKLALPGALTVAGSLVSSSNSAAFGTLNTLNSGSGLIVSEHAAGAGFPNAYLMNTTNTAGAVDLVLRNDRTDGVAAVFQFGAGTVGSIAQNGSSTAYNTTSDYRLKVTFGAADVGALIDGVPVYDAEMKYGDRRPMFLAHELQSIAPWAVSGNKDATQDVGDVTDQDGSLVQRSVVDPGATLPPGHTWTTTGNVPVYQQVDHTALIPTLWAAVQDLRKRIAALEARP